MPAPFAILGIDHVVIAVRDPDEAAAQLTGLVGLDASPGGRHAGLGTALLTHAFAEFQRRGRKRAGLGVDAESTTGAVRLYERAGMRVLWRWDIWERTS